MGTKIKDFTDYRSFLASHFEAKRAQRSGFTYGAWAKKLGLRSTSSLTKVIKGQRNPGEDLTQKFVRYFKFGKEDARYFSDLIELHKIRGNPRMTALLLEHMERSYRKGKLKLLSDAEFQVISNWLCLAVRETLAFGEIPQTPSYIAKQFRTKVTPRQVRYAIQNLLEVGLLKRDRNGVLHLTTGTVHSKSDFANEAVRRYHKQMLEQAKGSLDRDQVSEREFTSMTFMFDETRMEEAKEMIREFKDSFHRRFESNAPKKVVQFQVQFFPLTHSFGDPNENH